MFIIAAKRRQRRLYFYYCFEQVNVCWVILRNTEQKNFVFKPIFQSTYADPTFSSLDFVYEHFTYRPGFSIA